MVVEKFEGYFRVYYYISDSCANISGARNIGYSAVHGCGNRGAVREWCDWFGFSTYCLWFVRSGADTGRPLEKHIHVDHSVKPAKCKKHIHVDDKDKLIIL